MRGSGDRSPGRGGHLRGRLDELPRPAREHALGDVDVVLEADAGVSAAPDPFGGREVPFEIAARRLPNRTFSSADDARDAWQSAERVILSGIAAGGPAS